MNTIVRRQSDGKLIGYNTDCEGAISAIEDGLKGRVFLFFSWPICSTTKTAYAES